MSKYGDSFPVCLKCEMNKDGNCVQTKKCAYFRSWFSGAWEEVKKSAEAIRK